MTFGRDLNPVGQNVFHRRVRGVRAAGNSDVLCSAKCYNICGYVVPSDDVYLFGLTRVLHWNTCNFRE